MTFLHPAFLWGLIALAVPIIVHFFYLRRSKRYIFTQTRLLEKLIQSSRPYLRLNHLILLFLRLLIVVVIVFLFAEPIWGSTHPPKTGKVSALILVDVSPSMRSHLIGGITFLKDLLLKEQDLEEGKVIFTDRLYGEGRFRSIRECIETLSEAKPADMGYPLSRILQNIEGHFVGARGERRRVYILSDFQKTSVGEITKLPKNVEYALITMPLNLSETAYVDSVATDVVGGKRILKWHLQGKTNRSYTVRQDKNVSMVVSPGWRETPWPEDQNYITLEVAREAAATDSRFFVGLLGKGEARRWISIVSLSGIPKAFERLGRLLGVGLKQGWNDSVQVSIWISQLPETGEQASWVERGGILVVFAPSQLTLSTWTRSFLSKRLNLKGVAALDRPTEGLRPLRHELWEGVFRERPIEGVVPALFRAKQMYRFEGIEAYPLLVTDTGEVLLWEIPWGEGRVYLFTFPWAEANFGEQNLFPVFFERLLARYSQARESVGAFFLGRSQTLSLPAPEGTVRLRQVLGGLELIPPQRQTPQKVEIQVGDYPLPAGLYEVYTGEKKLGYIGANINPEEYAPEVIEANQWEAMGLPVRLIAPEREAVDAGPSWNVRWRRWYGWVLLAVGLLLLESWWAKRLLRMPLRMGVPSAV